MLTEKETGKAFNYPQCCIDYFVSGERDLNAQSWGGFIPCPEHQKLTLEEITKLLGRNPLIDDVLIEEKCESCGKLTDSSKLRKDSESNFLCPNCLGDPDKDYCLKCKNEICEWEFLAIGGEMFCYQCFAEKHNANLNSGSKLTALCSNETIPITEINYVNNVLKNSFGNTTINFECENCGLAHDSEIINN